ncbi:MAG: hypothetical protein M1454_02875 [Candidatus Thermoplasmatota archaeon]|nr:hypothetical protein [Candidatus Thermoplasmatota archaeon]MCL5731413.1 hypothetical protein [Candidatus Thermoplasmatota archaeon]
MSDKKGRNLEIYFMAAVIVILFSSAVMNYVEMSEHPNAVATDAPTPPAGSYVIHVVATQWEWTFIYPNNTTSAGAFSVPVNREITLIVTSMPSEQGPGVIHDLYIPQMDVQVYAVPGQNNSVTFEPTHTGSYYFECVEYCGEYHYEMRGYMEVVAQ